MPPQEREHERAAALLQEVAHKFGVSIRSMRGDHRKPADLAAKREFCRKAIAAEIPRSIVADILHKDVSTIAYHLHGRVRDRKKMLLKKQKERAQQTKRLALVIITGPIP